MRWHWPVLAGTEHILGASQESDKSAHKAVAVQVFGSGRPQDARFSPLQLTIFDRASQEIRKVEVTRVKATN
jgi:hypothetical protein